MTQFEKSSQDDMPGIVEDVSNEDSWPPVTERKLVRKIDLILIPTLWVMSLLSWMDRANLGNANIAGMTKDLGMSSAQFSLSITTFHFGYIAYAPISNAIIARTRPSLYLPLLMLLWGVVTAAMGKVTTYGQLVGLRTIIGALEGGFTPGVAFVFSCWYRPDELGKRIALYITSGVMGGAFGGLIAGGVIDHLEGACGIRGWRWLFIVEGATTVAAAIIAVFLLPDYPATCRQLTAAQKTVAVKRLQQAGILIHEDKKSPNMAVLSSLLKALQDWRTYAFSLAGICVATTLAMSYFYPMLVKGLGYTNTVKAQYMTVPIWIVGLVFTLTCGFLIDRAPQYRGLLISGCMTLMMIMSIVTCAVYGFTARYVFLALMTGGIWGAYSQILAYTAQVFQNRPPEVRAMSVGLITMLVNTGNIYGSYLFPREDAPKYLLGFGVVSGTAAISIVTYGFIWYMERRRLRKEE